MKYNNIEKGIFIDRPNRFIAHVELNGRRETVHVKNTGRCRELLVPGAEVYLERSENPARKTAYDLVAVKKGGLLINMDSQAPNKVFAEFAADGGFQGELDFLRGEVVWGNSRFDFCAEKDGKKMLIEVKGVTLEENGVVRFPDAPTERGVKHINELAAAHDKGYDCFVVFVVQMSGAASMEPNDATHPQFGEALRRAALSGVNVLAYECTVTPDSLEISGEIPVKLEK